MRLVAAACASEIPGVNARPTFSANPTHLPPCNAALMLRSFFTAELRSRVGRNSDEAGMSRRTEVIQRVGNRSRWVGLVLTFGLVSGCATQLRVGSDYDQSATFRNYHTFTVMQREHRALENP